MFELISSGDVSILGVLCGGGTEDKDTCGATGVHADIDNLYCLGVFFGCDITQNNIHIKQHTQKGLHTKQHTHKTTYTQNNIHTLNKHAPCSCTRPFPEHVPPPCSSLSPCAKPCRISVQMQQHHHYVLLLPLYDEGVLGGVPVWGRCGGGVGCVWGVCV